jgi:uncharacterized protein YqhQ
MPLKLPAYGGQALIEGVLMRGTRYVAAAMRLPDGTVHIQSEPLTGIYTGPIRKIPFLRGLILLWDALGLGMKYLTDSANLQTGSDEKIEGPAFFATIGVSLAIGVGLFFVLPALVGGSLEKWLGISLLYSNIIEGVIRLLFMITYIYAIGFMPDIKRVFGYHGAEHKTINAFEQGLELTPESVSKSSIEHPRCGTSFILTLMVVSIIVFSFFGPMPLWLKLITRVVLIPVIAGIAYEYTRFTANNLRFAVIRILIKPNLALQKLTTREPDLKMIEIAIASFTEMYRLETAMDEKSRL